MSSAARSWRTAFLTLRDETLALPSSPTVLHLLDQLIYSQYDCLLSAASDLPPHEVSSDLMLLLDLARHLSRFEDEGVTEAFVKLSHLFHGVCHCTSLEMNSTYWDLVLDSFNRMVEIFLGRGKKNSLIGSVAEFKATNLCLESIRCLYDESHKAASLVENESLLNFLLQVVGCFQGLCSSYFAHGGKLPGHNIMWETLTVAFTMVGEVYSGFSSSLPVNIWQSTIDVMSKVMDIMASKGFLVEDKIVATFYVELLHCLHVVVADPRGYLACHVSGFVAALRLFFRYGVVNNSCSTNQLTSHKDVSMSKSSHFAVSSKSENGPYRPPHLRKKAVKNIQHTKEGSLTFPKDNLCKIDFTSSDSDCSDNDGSMDNSCFGLFCKARLGAIVCIQDLCRSDPKSFTVQWAILLPSNDVLQHRKYEASLMSCFLFDPSIKVRIAAGSTIMAMLDGPASVSLQIAEFKRPSKCGSFTSLSSSLGHILMQLHLGTLHLIKQETQSRLLELSFKILMLLVSSTPYSRMSEELLPMVISSVQSRISESFPFQIYRNGLLESAINCLTMALSVSPPSLNVSNMLQEEVSTGLSDTERNSGVLHTLFRYSDQSSSSSASIEAFQALKALAHNYPQVMTLCWEKVSSIVCRVLSFTPEVSARSWKSNAEQSVAVNKERVMTASIKVLDECLRAVSGFKGTEDLANDKFLDSPFTSDCIKTKAISSAPLYSLQSPISNKDEPETFLLASERWSEVTAKHMPLIVKHSSAMVRAAAATCFAGMTSSVYFLLSEDKQDFIVSSSIDAAIGDDVPSVRSAACRAIGVIACFPQLYHSEEILGKFIYASEHNTCDPLLSVRITASWSLANICNSLGHCMGAHNSERAEARKCSEFIRLLVDSALRLTKDNDKVKANGVRALGNLARFVQFTNKPAMLGEPINCMRSELESSGVKTLHDYLEDSSHSFHPASSLNCEWLEKMVHAFLSCVTTGNVKVQWNVCHALSNLFFNKTLKLQDKDWASSVFSILLLLLRDSSNFKIKIQAAAALAVPETMKDYGRSYYDVIKTMEHIVENLKSNKISAPSNFKYVIALEKQLTSTMLHLLGLAATCDLKTVQEFLIKKAVFLEVWIKGLCSSLGDTSNTDDQVKNMASVDQKKEVLSRTFQSLIDVYKRSNQHSIAQRFERLASTLF